MITTPTEPIERIPRPHVLTAAKEAFSGERTTALAARALGAARG